MRVFILLIVGVAASLNVPVTQAGEVQYQRGSVLTPASGSISYSVSKGEKGESEYREGEKARLKKDFKRAEKYLSKSAQKGYGLAHFRLGQMYATGRGSVRSLVEAHMHYNLASYLGVEDGRKAMLVMEPQLTEDQLERAMRRAVSYRERYHL